MKRFYTLSVTFLLLFSPAIWCQWIQMGLNNNSVQFVSYSFGKYFASVSGGISVSANNGLNWNLAVNSPAGVNEIIVNDNVIYSAGGAGVYCSHDSGRTWAAVNNGLPAAEILCMTSLGLKLFAGTRYNGLQNNGVYSSSNQGNNWIYKSNGLSSISINKSLISFHEYLFLTSVYFEPPGPAVSGGFYISSDGGETWLLKNSGLYNYYLNKLAVIPTQGGFNIFVTDQLNPGGQTPSGVHISSDLGESWHNANAGIEDKYIISLEPYQRALFAASATDIFVTTDNGTNWLNADRTGLPSTLTINSLSVIDDTLYVSTELKGIWKRPISEFNIVTYSENYPDKKEFSLLQNYPNPFNPGTTIKYSLSTESFVTIKVYDLLGRKITDLVGEIKPAGNYECYFNAGNLSSGIYFYEMKAGKFSERKKFLLLK